MRMVTERGHFRLKVLRKTGAQEQKPGNTPTSDSDPGLPRGGTKPLSQEMILPVRYGSQRVAPSLGLTEHASGGP